MIEKLPFIITIDTEGDSLWAKPRIIETKNVIGLYRFQELCNRYKFKPVYLTNYEMAISEEFVKFGKYYSSRGQCEIGMHLHAWNSPPEFALTDDDYEQQPYLYEYPKEIIDSKVRFMTELLGSQFSTQILSHRAGRWSMSKDYFSILEKYGYLVDCSVTPGIDWSRVKGKRDGKGGTDYFKCAHYPYVVKTISKNGILEVPMTIEGIPRIKLLSVINPIRYYLPKHLYRVLYKNQWLRPRLGNIDQMKQVVRNAIKSRCIHLEFMIHSSELSEGLNPNFKNEDEIEKLYFDLEVLFSYLSDYVVGMTLVEFHQKFQEVYKNAI